MPTDPPVPANPAPAIAVIPARYASTRFPAKPLAADTGKPLIQHVVEQVRQATSIDRIIVATDDDRIARAVQAFGGQAMMTREDHPNGTCRIAEVVERLGPEAAGRIIVNVQGDEPQIEPAVIDQLVAGLENQPEASMATLASTFNADEDPADPNIVKLLVDQRGYAIYFSRALIPFVRDGQPDKAVYLKHPGLYAYRAAFLLEYVRLAPTPLEELEKLEQLRAIEHGHHIAVIKTRVRHHGIDTPEQYRAFVEQYRRDHGENKR